MIKLSTASRFLKSFDKLPIPTQKQATKAIRLFVHNPRYPSLHFEKVGNPKKNLHTIRVNQGDRILLVSKNDEGEYLLLDIGTHEEIYRQIERTP